MSEAVIVRDEHALAGLPPAEWWGLIDYLPALDRMAEAHTLRTAGQAPDGFFYLEHPPVITYGRATPECELQLGAPEIPRLAVPRGGLATYHAPGQLVGYLVMDLRERAGGQAPDIHAYLRAIELGLIAFLSDEFGLEAGLREGFTGVWTTPAPDAPVGRKLASIGVSARKWVTSHGFALNICPDMRGFEAIVPCGITDAAMTSVEKELILQGRQFTRKPMEQWAAAAHRHISAALQDAGWLHEFNSDTLKPETGGTQVQ